MVKVVAAPHARPRFVGNYDWSNQERSVSNIRRALSINNPELFKRISKVNPAHLASVQAEVVNIQANDFRSWGIGRVVAGDFKFFEGSHELALIAAFPSLRLHPFDFPIRWGKLGQEKRCAAVRYRIFKHRLELLSLYEKWSLVKAEEDREPVAAELYGLGQEDFREFGLGTLVAGRGKQYFGASTVNKILPQVFPELKLNPYLFKGRTFHDIYEAEAAVRSVLFDHDPEVKKLYDAVQSRYSYGAKADPQDLEDLKKKVVALTYQEFLDLGFRYLLSRKKFPGFKSSYRTVLCRSFSLLGLKESDLYRTPRWRSEKEARDNVRRAVLDKIEGLAGMLKRLDRSKLLTYRLGVMLMAVSIRSLSNMGIAVTGKGGGKYFNRSAARALDLSFPEFDLPAFRRKFIADGYSLATCRWLVEAINRFERIRNRENGITEKQKRLLAKLGSDEFEEKRKAAASKAPLILLIAIAAIRRFELPKLLQMLS